MNKLVSTATGLALATVALGGCFGHWAREAHEEEFADRVAQKCVEATRPTEVIVVPGAATTTVSAPSSAPR